MDDQQQFCLRWNDFQTNMVASFKHLRDEKSFTDVTIACDGQSTKAHKMILSACSPYFKVISTTKKVSMTFLTCRLCWRRTRPSTRSSSSRTCPSR